MSDDIEWGDVRDNANEAGWQDEIDAANDIEREMWSPR